MTVKKYQQQYRNKQGSSHNNIKNVEQIFRLGHINAYLDLSWSIQAFLQPKFDPTTKAIIIIQVLTNMYIISNLKKSCEYNKKKQQ